MAPSRRAFVILYIASGVTALLYEVTWTRMLTLVLGHTVAAASTVLAALMGGMALGSWIGGRIELHLRDRSAQLRGDRILRAYAALEIPIALSAFALPSL